MSARPPAGPPALPTRADAVIVGAGPAGATAAYHLARSGHDTVLLDRAAVPGDKACGGAITPTGVDLLAEMGVPNHMRHVRRVGQVTVSLGPPGSRRTRHFRHAPEGPATGRHGLVVPRGVLDAVLSDRAVAAGASFHRGVRVHSLVRTDDCVRGVVVSSGRDTTTLYSPVVVAADGATSALARQAGLASEGGRTGHGISARFAAVDGLGDSLRFFLPLTEAPAGPAGQARLPTYGWIFPAGDGHAHVGVGVAEQWPAHRLAALFTLFTDELRTALPGFANARPCGTARRAPLNFAFEPHRSWAPGIVLVGDAAGLTNPATGEGIGFALESGRIAAEVIHARLAVRRTGEQLTDLSGYATALTARFSGYLETGDHAASRHRLALRVLEDTFESEQPVFALARRAMLSPDPLADAAGPDSRHDIRSCIDASLHIVPRLVAVGEILADTVRTDWPFLTRLHPLGSPRHIVTLRPAVLLLLAAQFGGHGPDQPEHVPAADHRHGLLGLAAAADLAAAAALAQGSVVPTGTEAAPNWGTKFAVLTADLLFARAFQLCATSRADLTARLAQGVEEACRGRVQDLAPADSSSTTAQRERAATATGLPAVFATACELGVRATSGAPGRVKNLAEYGRSLGLALRLADDLSRLSGGTDRLGRDAGADLDPASDSLPIRYALDADGPATAQLRSLRTRSPADRERVTRLIEVMKGSGALDRARDRGRRALGNAARALTRLPDGPARRSLRAIATQVEIRYEAGFHTTS